VNEMITKYSDLTKASEKKALSDEKKSSDDTNLFIWEINFSFSHYV